MKRLTGKTADDYCGITRQGGYFAIIGFSIGRVADKRVSAMGHVNPDLVGPAGFEPALDKRCHGSPVVLCAEAFNDPIMGYGAPSIGSFGTDNGTLDTATGCASKRRINRALHVWRYSPHDRVIGSLQHTCPAVVCEGCRQGLVRAVRLCRDQYAGCILVKSMNNPRTLDAANSRQ